MRTLEFRCPNGHGFSLPYNDDFSPGWSMGERGAKLLKFEVSQTCKCGAPATRLFHTSLISVDNTGYNCPITNKWVGSKREHENNLSIHGCRVLESGETETSKKRREAEDAKLDQKIEATVEKEIDSYSSDKREKLYRELVNNDLQVERR